MWTKHTHIVLHMFHNIKPCVVFQQTDTFQPGEDQTHSRTVCLFISEVRRQFQQNCGLFGGLETKMGRGRGEVEGGEVLNFISLFKKKDI